MKQKYYYARSSTKIGKKKLFSFFLIALAQTKKIKQQHLLKSCITSVKEENIRLATKNI